MSESENYTSVWDAIADTPGQAASLRARAELMQQIAARVSRFSLDALVNISTALGCRVRVDLEAA
jgi:predicted XRE-type DNA-binding protein